MSFATAIALAQSTMQTGLEAFAPAFGNPTTMVLKLGASTSDAIVAAISIKPLATTYDRHGQASRVQPCTVDVQKSLLPNWATADSLPSVGKVVAGSKTFKIDQAKDNGHTLHITAFRWPNDDD
jgi:hypothetical protein